MIRKLVLSGRALQLKLGLVLNQVRKRAGPVLRRLFGSPNISPSVNPPKARDWHKASRLASQCCDEVHANRHRAALQSLEQALNAAGVSRWTPVWVETLEQILLLSGPPEASPVPPNLAAILDRVTEHVPKNKLLVGGTGWSGSGAVFDYLREFEQVAPIKGEFRHLEGRYGIWTLLFTDGQNSPDRPALLDFFFYCLLGLSVPSSWSEESMLKSARIFLKADDRGVYAKACRDLTTVLVAFSAGKVESRMLPLVVEWFVDSMIQSRVARESRYYLLDNVIHSERVKILRLFRNVHYFAVFRDPRSQYCSMLRENPRFDGSVEKFVKDYEERVRKFVSGRTALKGKAAVYRLTFEEFVLRAETRSQIASTLGLETPAANERRYFKPSHSEANVFLHQHPQYTVAVEQIAAILPRYCHGFSRPTGANYV